MLKPALLFTSILVAASLYAPVDAQACSCMQPDVRSSFENNDTVVIGRIGRTAVIRGDRYFTVQVRNSFKGCASARQWILVKTAASSAACGTTFRVGETYLIMGNQEQSSSAMPVISTNLCTYNKRARELRRREWRFLKSSYESCNTCTSDRDCDRDSWCRPTQNNRNECTPYASEGESCGGFTPAWAQERCDPNLTCDVPANIPDAPGVCRSPCRSNRDCGRDQFCAVDGLCREDGSCKVAADCNLDGNAYAHYMCVGYGACQLPNTFGDGQCSWTCGNPMCEDLAGVDFGACDMVLGWKIVGGQCQSVSGCGNQGYDFFETENACRAACTTLPVRESR